MAPNYTLGVWKAPAASASILHPTPQPLPGRGACALAHQHINACPRSA